MIRTYLGTKSGTLDAKKRRMQSKNLRGSALQEVRTERRKLVLGLPLRKGVAVGKKRVEKKNSMGYLKTKGTELWLGRGVGGGWH